MFTLLEFLFQGFFEWVYSLILEIWNYFSSSLLNVMSLDFAYIKTHIPVVADISQVLLAVGWALLLGNLVFQALRGMASGLGFEGEDPKLLFARTFVFAFLLLASPQICETILTLTTRVITLLEIPDAINVHLVDDSVFGVLGASWVLVIIFDVITMFMVFSLLLEVAERYMVLAMLTVTAPLAFAMGGSKSTSEIFTGWCRMFGSMCLLMATNIVFFKMLLSVVSTVPSFPDVFLWMVLIVSIVKVAKKADEIITRIGLNPAITGNRSTLPGMLAYTVFRTALSIATKGAANGIGGALGMAGKGAAGAGKSAAGLGGRAAGGVFRSAGRGAGAAAAGAAGGIGGAMAGASGQQSSRPRYGGGRQQNQQSDSQQEYNRQGQQTKQNTSQTQTGSQQQNTSRTQTSSQQQTAAQEYGRTMGPQGSFRVDRSSRKTSVPQGAQRAPSYVTPSSRQKQTEEKDSHSSSFSSTARSGGFSGSTTSRGRGFNEESRRGSGFSRDIMQSGGTSQSSGFGGSFGTTSRRGGFSGASRGGSFSKDTAQSRDTPQGSSFADAGASKETPRGGGTFGGRPSGTTRGDGFDGSFGTASHGGGFSGGSRGGGFSEDTRGGGFRSGSRGSGFGESARGGGFSGSFRSSGFNEEARRGGAFSKDTTQRSTSQGSRFGGIDTTKKASRVSGLNGDSRSGAFSEGTRGGGLSRMSASGTTQQITQSTSQKNVMNTAISQSGTAGTGKPTASTKRPTAPRGSQTTPITPKAMPTSPQTGASTSGGGTQTQRKEIRSTRRDRDKPIPQRPGSPIKPQMLSSAAGSQTGTAGTQAHSTQRPGVSEPRHSRNSPPVTSMPPSGAQRSGPVQQEQRQASKKDKARVKGSATVPHPGRAGTGSGPRIPPGQKLSGGPASQNPTRQTNREGGPERV